MLPKKKRVTKNVFQSIIKERKTLSTTLFLFHFKKSDTPQYAFVAPKNIFKKAIERNKYRRIGYNILIKTPPINGSGIFVYKKPSYTANQKEIKEEIIFILNKAGIINKTL
jgi:ribonuclease P protein component